MPEPEVQRRAVSYVHLRQWLGIIGAALPFVLIIGNAFLRAVLQSPAAWRGWDLQSSMSAYYYTNMTNVFVGALCAIGAFLLSYKGDSKADARAGTIAGLCAIGAGLFPTKPPHGRWNIIAVFHLSFAAVLYLTLAYFSIVLFTRTEGAATRRNALRNRVYRICGWSIVSCLVLIAVAEMPFARTYVGSYHPALWFESGATVAFGISWLTKGEKVLPVTDVSH